MFNWPSLSLPKISIFNDGIGINSLTLRLSNIPNNLNKIAYFATLLAFQPQVAAASFTKIFQLKFSFTNFPTYLIETPANYFVKFNGDYFATPEGLQLISDITNGISHTNQTGQTLNITTISQQQLDKMKAFNVEHWGHNKINLLEWGTTQSWVDVCHVSCCYADCYRWEDRVIAVIDGLTHGLNFTVPKNTTTPFPHPTHTPNPSHGSSSLNDDENTNVYLIIGLATGGFILGGTLAYLYSFLKRRQEIANASQGQEMREIPVGDLIRLHEIEDNTPIAPPTATPTPISVESDIEAVANNETSTPPTTAISGAESDALANNDVTPPIAVPVAENDNIPLASNDSLAGYVNNNLFPTASEETTPSANRTIISRCTIS